MDCSFLFCLLFFLFLSVSHAKNIHWRQSFGPMKFDIMSSPMFSMEPLLFLLYINDLSGLASSTARLFSSDCLLHRTICGVHDASHPHADLTFHKNWREPANCCSSVLKKCEVLRITNTWALITSCSTIHGTTRANIKPAKYHGLNSANILSWNHLIVTILRISTLFKDISAC